MQVIADAEAFFRSKGYIVRHNESAAKNGVLVFARERRIHIGTEEIGILQHVYALFPIESAWVVRDCNHQVDIDEHYISLDDAAHAISSYHFAWLQEQKQPEL